MNTVEGIVEWLGDSVEAGLTSDEITTAETTCGVRFPLLWRAVLRRVHPVGETFPDWRLRDGSAARMVAAPVDGLLFDVAHNDFWWPSWGAVPAAADERLRVATERLAGVPRLVPIRGYWYIAQSDDSPVFSVVQSDLWSPAASLTDLATSGTEDWGGAIVPFWSDLLAWSQGSQGSQGLPGSPG